jgi:glycosyltransferase involved in cell wall biosynthesis
LINPTDSQELGETIFQVISDNSLRNNLISQGHAQAKLFSWEKTARLTLAAYQSLI